MRWRGDDVIELATLKCAGMASTIETAVRQDGTHLRYRVWHATKRDRGTIVIVPGMMSHSAWFSDFAAELGCRGLHVVGAERRDNGLNFGAAEPTSRKDVLNDIELIIERELRPGPVWLAGWCWGALPAVCFMLQTRINVAGLVLLAPGLFPSGLITRAVQQLEELSSNINTSECVLPSPISEYMFSARNDIQTFILRDPLAKRTFSPGFLRISRELAVMALARLHTLKLPVLLGMATRDVTVDEEATFLAVRKVQAPVTIIQFDCNHAMLMEAPSQVADQVIHWIDSCSLKKSA